MGYPVVTVEVAFSTDPFSAPGAWTDITAYVRPITTRRGRQTELDRIEAGVGSITLRNQDRRFEPENVAGAYYPNVKPMRHCRIRSTFNAITYDIFRGFIESWTPSYAGPPNAGKAEVVVQLVDAYKLLALTDLRALQLRALDLGAIAVYPMDDTDFTCRDVASTPANGTYVGATIGAGGSPFGGGAPVADYDGVDDRVDFAAPTKIRDALKDSHTIAFWFYVDTIAAGVDYLFSGDPAVDIHVFMSGGDPRLIYKCSTTSAFMTLGYTGFTLDAWHFAAFVRDKTTGKHRLVVDGVERESSTDIAMKSSLDTAAWDLAFMTSHATPASFATNGAQASVMIFDRALSDADIDSLYRAPIDGIAAAASGAQVGAVLDAADWPSAERSIDSGSSVLTAFVPDGTALALLQEIEDSEAGLLFMAPDGKVGFHDRHSTAKAPHNSSAATFGDGGGAEIPYAYDGAEFSFDDENIWNHITVTREGGVPQIAEDSASIATYGRRDLERSGLRIQTDLEAMDLANFLLSRYKDPLMRLKSLKLSPTGNDSVWPQALGRDIHFDRVTVKRRPPPSGTISKEVHVASVEHEIYPAARTWTTTMTLTPADPLTYWLLGDSTYGLLGTTTRLGY